MAPLKGSEQSQTRGRGVVDGSRPVLICFNLGGELTSPPFFLGIGGVPQRGTGGMGTASGERMGMAVPSLSSFTSIYRLK